MQKTQVNAGNVIALSSETLVNSQSLGKILGISPQRVRQLVADGVIKREENRKYRLIDNVQAYYNYKTKDTTADFDKEHTLLEKAKRQMAELALAEKKKDLHRTSDIEIMVGGMITVFKRNMLSIPNKTAKACEGKSTAQISEILTKEINNALIELSKFDANKLGEYNEDTEEDD